MKTVPARERDRPPERKHVQRLAAAALEVLVELGDPVKEAADTIERCGLASSEPRKV